MNSNGILIKGVLVVVSLLWFFTPEIQAQNSHNFFYQIVVRDHVDSLVVNRDIRVRARIINQSSQVYYEEIHEVTTNTNALATMKIGDGSVVSGNMESLNLGIEGEKLYLRLDIDPNGGSIYSVTSIDPLQSVPLASYANVVSEIDEYDPIYGESIASKLTDQDLLPWDEAVERKQHIGDVISDGVVFYVDSTGENGLLVSTQDHEVVPWSPDGSANTGLNHYSDGKANTESLVNTYGVGNYAAYHSDTLASGTNQEWYLPSALEWSQINKGLFQVNRALNESIRARKSVV